MLGQHMQIINLENACSWKMKWNDYTNIFWQLFRVSSYSGNFFFRIISTLLININATYIMCYPMGFYNILNILWFANECIHIVNLYEEMLLIQTF